MIAKEYILGMHKDSAPYASARAVCLTNLRIKLKLEGTDWDALSKKDQVTVAQNFFEAEYCAEEPGFHTWEQKQDKAMASVRAETLHEMRERVRAHLGAPRLPKKGRSRKISQPEDPALTSKMQKLSEGLTMRPYPVSPP